MCSEYPKINEKLFLDGKDPGEYAYIGWGDEGVQFYAYSEGYKNAADLIIKHALTTGFLGDLDSLVYPACFLYRQYIELALKGIYLSNTKDTQQNKIATIEKCGHNLLKIWEKAKSLIIADYPNEDHGVLMAVENYIKEFDSEDKRSFAFRYPVDKKTLELIHNPFDGNNDEGQCRTRKVGRFIDLSNLLKRMNELHSFFYNVSADMDVKRDSEAEMQSA